MNRILVTGANKGIGRAIVEALIDRSEDIHVVMGARNPERGHAAREAVVAERPGVEQRVSVVELDVTSEPSVAAAAAAIASGSELYGVVNNAGIGRAAGGLREILDVNTRGVQRVCEAMLPHLAVDGRIVNITSASGPNFVSRCSRDRQAFFLDGSSEWGDLEELMAEVLAVTGGKDEFERIGLGDGDAYGLSKALANTYTLQLARRHPEVMVNACTPGFIETDLTRHYAEAKGVSPQEMGMKPPSAATRAPLHLLFGMLAGNGWYYGSDAQRSPLDRYRSPGDPPYTGT